MYESLIEKAKSKKKFNFFEMHTHSIPFLEFKFTKGLQVGTILFMYRWFTQTPYPDQKRIINQNKILHKFSKNWFNFLWLLIIKLALSVDIATTWKKYSVRSWKLFYIFTLQNDLFLAENNGKLSRNFKNF